MSQVRPTPIQPKPFKIPKARKGLRRASKKRALQLRAYAILKPIYIRSHPYCEMFDSCMRPTVTIHHLRGRAGELLCDEEWFRSTCAECHHFVHHETPNEARRLGLLLF